jgi:gliding motility-associated-like protein
MKRIFVAIFAMFSGILLQGQNTYQLSIGGIGNDVAHGMAATPSAGGYAIAGTTNSFRASISDMFLAKLTPTGDTAWIHSFGGNNEDRFEGRMVRELPGGGYILAGLAEGNGIGWQNKRVVVLRLQADGRTIQWARSYHLNDQYKELTDMYVRNNTIAITGHIHNGVGHGTNRDAFVLTIDADNPAQLQSAAFNRSGSYNDYATSVIIDSEDRIVIAGYSEQSTSSSFIIRLDAGLNLLWARNYDLDMNYNNRNYTYSIAETPSGYVIGGRSFYLSDRQAGNLQGYEGSLLLSAAKADGAIQWANTYGVAAGYSQVGHIAVDGNEIIASGEVSGPGGRDMFIMKTDMDGNVTWSMATGGAQEDYAVAAYPMQGGGYIIGGATRSYSASTNLYIAQFNQHGVTQCNQRPVQNELRSSMADFISSTEFTRASFSVSTSDIMSSITYRRVYMPAYCICSQNPDFESTAPSCSGELIDFRVTSSIDRLRSVKWFFGDNAQVPAGQDETDWPKGISYPTGGLKEVTLTIDDGACSGSVTKLINIRQSPAVNSVSFSSAQICANSTATLTAAVAPYAGKLAYHWDLGNGESSQAVSPAAAKYTEAKTVTASLKVSNEYGCHSTGQASMTVNPLPEAKFSSPPFICSGESADYAYTGQKIAGKTYTFAWDFGTGTGGNAAAENPAGVVYATAGQKRVSLTVTSSDQCSHTVAEALTVHLTPQVAIGHNAPQCLGEAVEFVNQGSETADKIHWVYSWDFGADATPSVSTAKDPQEVVFAAGGNKIISLKLSSDYCSKYDSTSIFIHNLPEVPIISDTTICANRSISIGKAAIAGLTYSWQSPDMHFTARSVANPVASPSAEYTQYTLTVEEAATACSNTASVLITMLKPAIANAGPDVVICYGDTVQIGASYIEGQSYIWLVDSSLSSSTAPSPLANPSQTTDYLLAASYAGCDMVFDTVRVTVRPLPDVKAKTANHTDSIDIALGQFTQFKASGAVQYIWEPLVSLDNAGIYNPVAAPEAAGLFRFTVQGTDIHGCVNYDSLVVLVREPNTWAPTSFSPNGDGLNDIFYVRTRGAERFLLQVFSRSGEMVYSSEDPSQGWDGRKQGTSIEMPVGAYVYYFQADFSDGTKENGKDVINLVR